MIKYFIIFNPGSKSGESNKKLGKINRLLNKCKINFELIKTKNFNDAYIFSKNANKDNYDVIVAVGGDGTINHVLNGFYDKAGKRVSNAKFGVIYTGTSPDFCKSYNIPIKLDDAINILAKCKSQKISIGKICLHENFNPGNDNKFMDETDNWAAKYFACCTNIGLGAALARRANSRVRKYLGDFSGTFISLIVTLLSYKPGDLTLTIDGKIKKFEKVFNLSIGKTFYVASGIKIKNNLIENDKRFYNLNVSNMNIFNLISIIKKIYSGKEIINDDIVSLSYCRKIEISGNNKNPEIEFDGDPAGFLPCRIEYADDLLDLITA